MTPGSSLKLRAFRVRGIPVQARPAVWNERASEWSKWVANNSFSPQQHTLAATLPGYSVTCRPSRIKFELAPALLPAH